MFVLRLGFCAFGECDVLMPHLNPQTAESAKSGEHCHSAGANQDGQKPDMASCCIDEDATQLQIIDLTFLNSTVSILAFMDFTINPGIAFTTESSRIEKAFISKISASRAIPVLTQRFLI